MLLVHSPLLTSASMEPLRVHLEAVGWRVAVPDLRALVEAQSFHSAVCAAAAASVAPGARTVVIGHSRAGAYLPGIVDAVGDDCADVVFLDARLPHPGTSWIGSLPPDRSTWMAELAIGARLPTWDTWFPDQSLDDVVPDPEERRRILSDLPELPWQVVTEELPEAGGAWSAARRVHCRLSAAYEPVAVKAEELGYVVRRADADHLAMATRPAMVAALLLSAGIGVAPPAG